MIADLGREESIGTWILSNSFNDLRHPSVNDRRKKRLDSASSRMMLAVSCRIGDRIT